MNLTELLTSSSTVLDQAIADRRYLHSYPEISDHEVATSAWLKERCRECGFEIVEVEGTGFIAILHGEATEGDTPICIGLRTDIDALPIAEAIYNAGGKKRSCLSQNLGAMHACGHDAHMAIQLAIARILAGHRQKIAGDIIFIFEQGEETHSGIDAMIDTLKNYPLTAIYGTHVFTGLPTHTVAITPGAVMSGMTNLHCQIKGLGGHSSRPDLARSPIFGAANFLQTLTNAWTNCTHPEKVVTLGIGSISGGSPQAYNVIPDKVQIDGTLRFFDLEAGRRALQLFNRVGETSCAYNELSYLPTSDHGETIPPVINDRRQAAKLAELVRDHLELSVLDNYRWYASETFARYSELCPCLFTLSGCRDEDVGSISEHHTEDFDIDEAVIADAISLALCWIYQQFNF